MRFIISDEKILGVLQMVWINLSGTLSPANCADHYESAEPISNTLAGIRPYRLLQSHKDASVSNDNYDVFGQSQ